MRGMNAKVQLRALAGLVVAMAISGCLSHQTNCGVSAEWQDRPSLYEKLDPANPYSDKPNLKIYAQSDRRYVDLLESGNPEGAQRSVLMVFPDGRASLGYNDGKSLSKDAPARIQEFGQKVGLTFQLDGLTYENQPGPCF